MNAVRTPRSASWFGETAGLIGIATTFLLCALAVGRGPGLALWSAVSVSMVGNLGYIAYVLTRRATRADRRNWRELVLATVVPAAAILVTCVIAGRAAGWFSLPFGPQATPARHVITIGPKQSQD